MRRATTVSWRHRAPPLAIRQFHTSDWKLRMKDVRFKERFDPRYLIPRSATEIREPWKDKTRTFQEHEHPSQPEIDRQGPRNIPVTCSGCGAFSQTTDPNRLGYYNVQSRRVRFWIHRNGESQGATGDGDVSCDDVKANGQPEVHDGQKKKRSSKWEADKLVQEVLNSANEKLASLGLTAATMLSTQDTQALFLNQMGSHRPPVCERCHDLKHYGSTKDTAKLVVPSPSFDSLEETIAESPHRHHMIYHVIDAADFPMSLIPQLHSMLHGVYMRTRNRRSDTSKFKLGRSITMCFVITRADLLAPQKEMVDRMMPYFRQVLRDALGSAGTRLRLDVTCVSPVASWWVDKLRERLFSFRGASWLVGKVNVGKSRLFQDVLPKHRKDIPVREQESIEPCLRVQKLLPPLQPERDWPEMPLSSPHPGTTVSPIRIPYGTTRFGPRPELIDMPGLQRDDMTMFVKDEYRESLVLRKRIVPEQFSLTSDKALLLGGGLIRIVPRTNRLDFLMYNFTPIPTHLTSAEKAIEFQEETRRAPTVKNWMAPGTSKTIRHAGTFKLIYDVTKKRAGPLTRKDAVSLRVDRLPFRVLSIDILIEGVGYVEIVAQVRARNVERYPSLHGDGEEASLDPGRSAESFITSEVEKKLSSEPSIESHITKSKVKDEPSSSALAASWVTAIDNDLKPDTRVSVKSWVKQVDSKPEPGPEHWAKSLVTEKGAEDDIGFEPPPNVIPQKAEFWQKIGLEPPPEPIPEPPPDPLTKEQFQDGLGFHDSQMAEAVPRKEYDALDDWPAVDVYSPEGRFVAFRRPLHGWENNKPARLLAPMKARPRRSMKGAGTRNGMLRFQRSMAKKSKNIRGSTYVRDAGRIRI
ncbi:hypothetical protein CP533_0623 [Ophiocordyceps camponoti-saundersi (nom. inval.)]|nr:hypothetical protein CP533_0623 [Ophiocordyceps camponoti-saundersi (nom. inval.)]